MRIKYLGTGAAEGFPGLFCECTACRKARDRRGKNLKMRSCTLLNDSVLIDISPDIFAQSLSFGIRMSKIKAIVCTHSHEDHLDLFSLMLRCRTGSSHLPDIPPSQNHIHVYGSRAIIGKIEHAFSSQPHADRDILIFHELKAYRPYLIEGLEFTPLPAQHIPAEECFLYCVREGKHSLLYANDTGAPTEDFFSGVERLPHPFTVVSLDCARGTLDGDGHMGIKEVRSLCGRLKKMGKIVPASRIYLNHFSHMCGMIHDEFQDLIAEEGLRLTYDGLTLEVSDDGFFIRSM